VSVFDVIDDYRKRLLERDASLALDYTRRWMRVEDALEAQYLNLAMDAADLMAAGLPVTDSQVYRLERYQRLLEQARGETERFRQFVAGAIEKEQYLAGQDGIGLATDSIGALLGERGIGTSFNILPIEAIRSMIGLTGDGSPLTELLKADYETTVARLTQTLINATAMGWNPRKTAQLMANAMAGNLQRALLVSRTEQMRAMRVAQVGEFRESGVVKGYRRMCALSAETCLACLLEDGRFYTTLEQYSDHPAGRCSAVPVLTLKGFDTGERLSGKDWLLAQKAGRQQEIMGRYYQPWKDGQIGLDRMSRMHNHPVWGESPQVVPLKELNNVE
jgi:hypothetical protein